MRNPDTPSSSQKPMIFHISSRTAGLQYSNPAVLYKSGADNMRLLVRRTPKYYPVHREKRVRLWAVFGGFSDHT